MKKIIQLSTIMLLTFSLISCDKDDDPVPPNPNVIFKATLNGASESTPNPSTATGNSTLTFNNTTKTFTVVTTFTGMTATAAHIHKGAVGVAGGVVFGFTDLTSPIEYTSGVLDATQETDLRAGLYYVNVHSAAYPAGEIRGQLIMQ